MFLVRSYNQTRAESSHNSRFITLDSGTTQMLRTPKISVSEYDVSVRE